MSLEKIREAISGKAGKESEQIIKKAEADRKEKIYTSKVLIRENIEKRLKEIEAGYQKEINTQIVSLNKRYRLKLLEIKNNIIDNIFTQALDRVIKQPDKEYLALLERWLLRIDNNLSGEIFFNARDLNRIDQGFIDRINSLRNGAGKIYLNKNSVDIKGSFIFKTKEFEIDQTLDTIIDYLRKELAPIIARELFYEK